MLSLSVTPGIDRHVCSADTAKVAGSGPFTNFYEKK